MRSFSFSFAISAICSSSTSEYALYSTAFSIWCPTNQIKPNMNAKKKSGVIRAMSSCNLLRLAMLIPIIAANPIIPNLFI